MSGSFLDEAEVSPDVQALYDTDIEEDGYIWNVSRLWAHQPETMNHLFDLMSEAFKPSGLGFRQRGILVTASASSLGDSYCSFAWGGKLAKAADPSVAAAVLNGTDEGLSEQERAMASWARKVVNDPNSSTSADIQNLREAGLNDTQIFSVTLFVALRLAFSTVNDALGAQPDPGLVASLPPAVVAAVNYGREPQH